MRRRRKLLSLAAVAALLALVLMQGACNGLFYRPSTRVYATAADYDLAAEDLYFQAPGGPQLHGWWVPAEGAAKGTVVYCHGNNANLTHHARFVQWLPGRGYNLLIFDYRGYGLSAGTPDRAGTIADALAAIDLAERRDPGRVLVLGHSLGGAVGLQAVAQRPTVRGLVVESSFSSYRAAAACTVPWLGFLVPLLVSAGHDPIDALAQIPPRPLLVIHGSADRITPLQLAEELYAAAAEPKQFWMVSGAGHRSPWVGREAVFERRLLSFFGQALGN